METTKPEALGTVIKLHLLVHEGEIRAHGAVRYTDFGKGMGVEFTAMGAEDRVRLEALMKRLLGSS